MGLGIGGGTERDTLSTRWHLRVKKKLFATVLVSVDFAQGESNDEQQTFVLRRMMDSQPDSGAGSVRKERMSVSSDFLVDIILPAKEIHLLAGPSGAGKTRWLLNILKEWEQGKPFLGFPSHPVKWAYAATDRSLRSVHRTMQGIGIDPETINIIPAWGSDKKTLPQIIDHATNFNAKLLVIESFGKFADGLNSNSVENHLNAVQGYIDKHDLTIIGVVESPKMKPNERYENPRQRVSGCAAWAHFTETIFLVEPTEVSDPKLPGRQLFVCPRNAPGMNILGAFDATGKIIFDPNAPKKPPKSFI